MPVGLRLWEVSFPRAGHIFIVQAPDEETAQQLACVYRLEHVADLPADAEAETLELHLPDEPGVIANYWGSNEED